MLFTSRLPRPVANRLTRLKPFLIPVFLWLLAISGTHAGIQLNGLEIDPASNIEIKVTSLFKQLPDAGIAPMQVFIRNNSGASRTWHFSFTSAFANTFTLSRDFTVENGGEKTFEVLVPLPSNDTNYSRNSVQINVRGYGIVRGYISHGSNGGSSQPPTAFLLMSPELAVRSWGPLEQSFQKATTTLHGSEFNPNMPPTDWRGYLGVDSILITDSEWMAMDATPRDAIREWVTQGGHLNICSKSDHAATDYGFKNTHPGYGRVQMLVWDGRELASASIKADISVKADIFPRARSLAQQLSTGYLEKWNLPGTIGILPLNGIFIIAFVILFGAVVGPLNLFWFAKSGRRHRLFWTTPLISLAGSGVLAGVIGFQDGLGGSGYRMISVHLVPDDKEAVVVQEQIARTGLLISTQFHAGGKIYLSPIANLALRRRKETASTFPLDVRNHAYSAGDDFYSGDWFASRSVQAQVIEEIRPTRARVEVILSGSDAPPALLSSVENTLNRVMYVDAAGKYWKTPQLRLGERKTLVPSNAGEFKQWWDTSTHSAGGRMLEMLEQAKDRRGYFYAVADSVKDEAVATLPSIRWKDDEKVIYLGECPEEKEAAKP